MRKFLTLAAVLTLLVLMLVNAAPVFANGEPGGYDVMPTLGGVNGNVSHTPPGKPVVFIPDDNPAIVENSPEPGEVFWP